MPDKSQSQSSENMCVEQQGSSQESSDYQQSGGNSAAQGALAGPECDENTYREPGSVSPDGNVDYYNRRHNDFASRYEGCYTPPVYYLQYGGKYADRFTNVLYPKLSSNGQAWLTQARINLQVAIESEFNSDHAAFDQLEKNDAAFTAFAYGTHADAYWNAGLGDLDLFDLAMIGLTPDIADLVPWSGISQAADIATRLGDKWVTDAIDSTLGQGTTEQLRDLAEEGFSEMGEGIDEVFGEGTTETLIDGLEEIAEAVPEIYEEGRELIGEGISEAEEFVGLPPGSVEDAADYLRENAQDGVNWLQDNVWSPLWE